MAIALVRQTAIPHSGFPGVFSTINTLPFASPPTVGNYIVALALVRNVVSASLSFSDVSATSNIYTTKVYSNPGYNGGLYYNCIGYAKVVSTTNPGVRLTCSGGTIGPLLTSSGISGYSQAAIIAAEFSGIKSTGTALTSAFGNDAFPSPGSMTLPPQGLSVAVLGSGFTGNGGFTSPIGFAPFGQFAIDLVGLFGYSINPTSPLNPTWHAGFGSSNWGASQFAFNSTGGSSGNASMMMHF